MSKSKVQSSHSDKKRSSSQNSDVDICVDCDKPVLTKDKGVQCEICGSMQDV
jgi:hypothetical protein